MKTKACLLFLIGLGLLTLAGEQASARTALRNICRVKGQEENTLRGLGMVVGLNGTGEANDPATMRALARSLEIMGSASPQTGMPGAESLQELRRIKNVALVWVSAKVPATGARRGDKLDCTVSAINGKSLEGGQLAFAALQGPNVNDNRVYALAEGAIHLDSPDRPLAGRIHNGCQMEEDVFTPFVNDSGQITLVLDNYHANFQTASDIVYVIRQTFFRENPNQVLAVNAANIVIQVPEEYRRDKDEVAFVSEVLELSTYSPEPEARVVINERTGSIVIHGEVQIGDVVISHREILVEATEATPRFSDLRLAKEASPKLSSLVDALNALKVPNSQAIEIIKDIDRSGKLHGRLIVY